MLSRPSSTASPLSFSSTVVMERDFEDFNTWKEMLSMISDHLSLHKSYILKEFYNGFKNLSSSSLRIPTSEALNRKLFKKIGWRIYYVSGFISTFEFAYLLSQKLYPVNFSIRAFKDILYSPEPDFVHDVLGHLPLLFFTPFRELIELWAEKTLSYTPLPIDNDYYECTVKLIKESQKNVLFQNSQKIKTLQKKLSEIVHKLHENPTMIWKLGNFFDWVFEFGILKNEEEQYQIFGGAILTSCQELSSLIDNIKMVEPLTLSILEKGISYATQQKKYYYVSDFTQYQELLKTLTILPDSLTFHPSLYKVSENTITQEKRGGE